MKYNTKYLAMCIFCIFLFSCSAEKQLARLHKKHPELFQKDTIRIIDTTVIPMVKADTVFRQSMVKDTMVIKEKNLTMRYYYSNDTVFLSGECKDTTIIKEILVPTEKAIITEGELPKWFWPVIICMAVFIGLLLFFRR